MPSSDRKPKIGFVGLGFMGHGIAKNIVDKGYALTILGRAKREAADDLIGRGAVEVKTSKAVAETSDIIFICVTGSPQVEGIIRGQDGLKTGLKRGSVVVDCSTSDPNSTLALATELAISGIDYADAPLGRTPKEAWAGTLDTMVGAKATSSSRAHASTVVRRPSGVVSPVRAPMANRATS